MAALVALADVRYVFSHLRLVAWLKTYHHPRNAPEGGFVSRV